MRFPPANVQLRRAQLVMLLAVLVPTVLTTVLGIIVVAFGEGVRAVLAGVLILTLAMSGITGYILVSIFVGKGASLARVQNDFLSSVSHELRTPLTSIRLFMDSLRDGRLSVDEARQVLKLLGGEVDRLELLVGRVLELSRMEMGGHPFARERVDIDALVREALEAFDAATLARPTKISVDVEPGLAMIGDHATLVRALVNLLVNAWKYTDDDKRISLTGRRSKRWIELTVADNGIGIDRAEQAQIFDEFARGRDAHARGTPGSGLGLAFVRTIARAHKGKVLVSSRAGEGSAFRMRLKRGPVEPGVDGAAQPVTAVRS